MFTAYLCPSLGTQHGSVSIRPVDKKLNAWLGKGGLPGANITLWVDKRQCQDFPREEEAGWRCHSEYVETQQRIKEVPIIVIGVLIIPDSKCFTDYKNKYEESIIKC